MKKPLFFMALIVLSLGLWAGGSQEDPKATKAADFAGYKSWEKVNGVTITGDETGVLGAAHERAQGFREIYINSVGRAVVFGEASYPFPAGTVIVKESFKNADGTKGALSNLTVMVKREGGYSPDWGDWEYIMANPSGKIQNQGRIRSCMNCHAAGEDKDYTFWDSKM